MFRRYFFRPILDLLEKIMATQADAAKQLADIATELDKVAAESAASVQAVADLQAKLDAAIAAGGTITPELQAAIDTVAAKVKAVDDLVPDAPPTS